MKDKTLIASASKDDNFSFSMVLMQKFGLKPEDLFFNQYNEPSYKTILLLNEFRKSMKGSEG
jgi:hypothetical protein